MNAVCTLQFLVHDMHYIHSPSFHFHKGSRPKSLLRNQTTARNIYNSNTHIVVITNCFLLTLSKHSIELPKTVWRPGSGASLVEEHVFRYRRHIYLVLPVMSTCRKKWNWLCICTAHTARTALATASIWSLHCYQNLGLQDPR